MRLATWCVDGINPRLPYLRHWLGRRRPDLVALQKTFTRSDRFPREALQEAGYESVVYTRDGEFRSGWGVAVLSRKTLPEPRILQEGLPGQEDPGARFLTVAVGDLEFSSVYALYEDPATFEGAIHRKIAWMQRLREHLEKRCARSGPCVMAGDFNVVSERDELNALLSLGFVDLYRRRHPDSRTGCNYEFNIRKPVCARLHRILGTGTVASRINEAWVDLEYRKEIGELQGCLWAQSAPVIVDLAGGACASSIREAVEAGWSLANGCSPFARGSARAEESPCLAGAPNAERPVLHDARRSGMTDVSSVLGSVSYPTRHGHYRPIHDEPC